MSLYDDLRKKAPRDFKDAVTKSFLQRIVGAGGLSRTALAASLAAGNLSIENGYLYTDGVVQYVGSIGATALPGLPDLLPFGTVYPDHFENNAIPGTTDMTAAINAALDYVRDTVSAETVTVNMAFLDGGLYRADSAINATLIRAGNFTLRGNGATIMTYASGAVAFDMLGSRYWHIHDLTIESPDSGSPPTIGLQLGRNSTSVADCHAFTNVQVIGHYSTTAVYNYASETCTFTHCRFWNSNTSSSSYALIQDGNNSWSVASAFAAVSAGLGAASFNENVFISLDARKNGGTGPCIWMSRTSGHRYYGCYLVSYDDATIVLSSDSFGHLELELNVHCETSFSPGLETAVRFEGNSPQTINGFKFHDFNCHAKNQVFAHGTGVTDITIKNADISLPTFNVTPSSGVFNNKSYFKVYGKVYVGPGGSHKNLLNFGGDVEMADRDLASYGAGSYFIKDFSNDDLMFKGQLTFGGDKASNITAGGLVNRIFTDSDGYHGDGIEKFAVSDEYITSIPSNTLTVTQSGVQLAVSGGGTITDIVNNSDSDLLTLFLRNNAAASITLTHNTAKIRSNSRADITLAQYQGIILREVSTGVWQQY